MASKNNINSVFTDIANSIRAKKGTTNTIQPINMAEEIDGITTGITPSGKIEITNTEEINVTNYETAQVVDSNLSAENIKKDVSILGVTGTFEGGGDASIEDGLITGEISGDYSNDRITKIRSYAFNYFSNLTSVSFPNATSIGSNAFSGCSKLTGVNIPNATSISNYAFYNCSNLTSVSFPNATSIGSNALVNCKELTSVSFPNATSIGSYAFNGCSKLTGVNIPNAASIMNSAFDSCYSLLKLVITQTNSVCTLATTNAFNNCYHFLGRVNSTYNPEGLKDGRIYVPDELVDSYKSATNWSVYADIIVPLSTLVE